MSMDLLFIRHGEPGEDGGLTEAGKREARLLAERLAALDIREYHVSPLRRARETAAPVLEKQGCEGFVEPWLREFDIPVARPDLQGQYVTDYPSIMAGALLSIIPLIIIYAIFQKQFIEGIALTGIKG